jgi:hypothetical protein
LIITLNCFVRIDQHAPRAFGVGQFAADQLPLDQKLAVDFVQRVDIDERDGIPFLDAFQAFAHRTFDGRPVQSRAFPHERKIRHIAGQADAAADDDVRIGAGAAQPFAALPCEFFEFDHALPSNSRISSRSREARS